MSAILAYLLVLVPAPTPEEPPSGPAPTLQYMKWSNGTFDRTEVVPVVERYLETVTMNLNGKQVAVTIEKERNVLKTVTVTIKDDGIEVYGLDGKKLDKAVWQKALGQGAVVMLVPDGQMPHAAYRKVFKEGTLIVVMKPSPQPVPMTGTVPVPLPPQP